MADNLVLPVKAEDTNTALPTGQPIVGTRRQQIVKVAANQPAVVADTLAVEEPLEIKLAYGPANNRTIKSISVTMRTPGNDAELAIGFLLTEGVLREAYDIERITEVARVPETADESDTDEELPYTRNSILVELAPDVEISLKTLERNFYTTSSCGICGKASLLALRSVCPPRRPNTFDIAADVLLSLPDRLRMAQGNFQQTGGLHAAGLFDRNGNLFSLREDVGRHNAVDKLFGAEFLADQTPLAHQLLLLSGRASFELLQKAVMAGVPMIASVGAPSSLAVRVAAQFDVTLIGFLRGDRFNIYHGADHVLGLKA
jgi:FdhD protein